jgi:hypothetical protein
MKRSSLVLMSLFLVAGCAPTPKPNLEAQIQSAVAQTVAAIPTYTPYPTLRIFPTPTSVNLSGLFCEYRFCIGHPSSMTFFDLKAQNNPQSPSNTSQGMLVGYNLPNLVIQVIWQDATGASDASFMLNTIMDGKVDTRNGDLKAFQVGNLNVDYVPITTTVPSFNYGGAAAWSCGGRAFAWKAYTTQADLARSLLNETVQRFRCDSQ